MQYSKNNLLTILFLHFISDFCSTIFRNDKMQLKISLIAYYLLYLHSYLSKLEKQCETHESINLAFERACVNFRIVKDSFLKLKINDFSLRE